MFQPKSLVVTENLQNEQKQQLRPYTNGNLHKLMEVSSSRSSEARSVASGNDQNICFGVSRGKMVPEVHNFKQSDDRIQSKYSKAYHREVLINPWPQLKSDFPVKQTKFLLKESRWWKLPFPQPAWISTQCIGETGSAIANASNPVSFNSWGTI